MSEVKNRKRNTAKAAAASESLSPVEALEGSDDPSNANGTLHHESVPKETPEVPRAETNDAFHYLSSWLNGSSKAFTVSIEIDAVSMALFFLALLTRMWRLEYPRSIVFDELHYGKFASLYMKNIFFFDSHPPLGKQLVALAGYLAGFDGDTEFDRIGGSGGSRHASTQRGQQESADVSVRRLVPSGHSITNWRHACSFDNTSNIPSSRTGPRPPSPPVLRRSTRQR